MCIRDSYDTSSAAGGSVSCELASGECTYAPPSGFSGEDSFTYEAPDGALVRNTATVTIGASSPATAEATAASTEEDSSVTVTLSGSDPESCELGFSIASGPAKGSLSVIGGKACVAGTPNTDTATVTYTPNPDFNGADSFTYKVSDGSASDTATVSVTVSAVNDAPLAVDDSASTDVDTAVSLNVLSNDSDLDGDSLALDRYDTSS